MLIQDIVNKRELKKDTYRNQSDDYTDDDDADDDNVDDDDDSFLSDFCDEHGGYNVDNKINRVNFNMQSNIKDDDGVDDKCINPKLFGNSNFIYADSNIFDNDEEHNNDSWEKLISAVDLLKESIEHNSTTQLDVIKYVSGASHGNSGSGGYGTGSGSSGGHRSRLHHHHHHHHNRRNTVRYVEENAQNRRLKLENFAQDERMMKRSEKVVIEVRVVFLKIGEIDTLKEIYQADAFIQAKWREPKLDNSSIEDIKPSELERLWNPLLFIDNILTETKDQYWLSASQNDKNETFIIERRKMKGVFLETLELNDFPLDVQDLTITISTERPDTEVDIIPDNLELSGINLQTFVDQQEWQLHEHVEVSKRVVTQEYTSSCRRHPCLSVTCRASRRPGYFYWNVFLVMFFITGLSFATFAVPPTRPENRLQLSFTLFLTSVAFKFVINQSLPRISYLTYMDKYVLMSLAILCIISIWHSVITLIKPAELDQTTTTSTNQTHSKITSSTDSSPSSASSTTTQSSTPPSSSLLPPPIKRHITPSLLSSSSQPNHPPGVIRNKKSLYYILNNTKIFRPYFQKMIHQKRSSNTESSSYSSSINKLNDDFSVNIPNYDNKQKVISTISSSSSSSTSKLSLKKIRKRKRKEEHLKNLRAKIRVAKYQKEIERYILISFVLMYFLAHLLFVIVLYFGASKRRREMVEKDRQYRKQRKKKAQANASSKYSFGLIPKMQINTPLTTTTTTTTPTMNKTLNPTQNTTTTTAAGIGKKL